MTQTCLPQAGNTDLLKISLIRVISDPYRRILSNPTYDHNKKNYLR